MNGIQTIKAVLTKMEAVTSKVKIVSMKILSLYAIVCIRKHGYIFDIV